MTDSEREQPIPAIFGDIYASVVFLTRLPAPPWAEAARRPLAGAMWAFPLSGVLVATVMAAIYAGGAECGLPPVLSALIAIAGGALLTGGLHEDGLADFADGLGGGTTPERRLEIMSDSRIGTHGVLVLVISIGGKAAALAAIGDVFAVFGALVAAAAISRGLLPIVVASMEPAKEDGLGRLAGRPTASVWAIALGLGVAIVILAAPGGWIGCLFAAAIAALATAWVARQAIGGYTGDVLGAVQQAAEFLALVLIAGVMTPGG